MRHSLFAVVCLVVASPAAMAERIAPARVVSLDYCADQFVLRLLPRERILAVSPDADQPFSYMRETAIGLPKVRPLAEDVILLEPDLVIRSYGGGPNAAGFFQQAGVAVLQVPYSADMRGIRDTITTVAAGLGVPERGADLVAEVDARLQSIRRSVEQPSALYMTPTGVTSGPGTLVHEMLRAAGLQNFEQQPGWRSIPLERLVYEQPDIVAAAFFDENAIRPARWSPMRHPVARQQMIDQPTVMLQGAWTSCGGWFLLDAIEALAASYTAVASR